MTAPADNHGVLRLDGMTSGRGIGVLNGREFWIEAKFVGGVFALRFRPRKSAPRRLRLVKP